LPSSGRYSTKKNILLANVVFFFVECLPKMAEISRRLAVLVYTFVFKFCAVVGINVVKIVQTVLKIKF